MCCRGCQAVAQAIVDAGMSAYYAQRTAMPEGAALVPPALDALAVYDNPALQANFLEAPSDDEVREVHLMLEGITCAACLWLNERHLAAQPGVLAVEVNFSTQRARIRWDSRLTRLSKLLLAVAEIGYRAHPFDARERDALMQRERRVALWRWLVAGLSSMQVMMYAVPVYLARDGDMAADTETLIRWASLLLTLPAVVYSSAHFFRNAWRDLRLRRAGMDVPVALGIGVAFSASVWATVSGSGQVYFDSLTMFVFLLLGGRYLELRVRQRAADALDRLGRIVPAVADRVADWPRQRDTEAVPVASLVPGDVVSVAPGAVLPADGVVVEGESAADESVLTGESLPVTKRVGATVTGGSINVESPLLVRVTQVGQDTVVSAIVRLLDRALSDKPQVAADADRLAGRFVAGILVLSALTVGAWMLIDPSRALWIGVSVLVVTCPCALALATPAALTAATTRLARQGVLITRGHALETLARVTDVVFDKTGTLTRGQLNVEQVLLHADADETECRALAAALEQGSRHPLALALLAGQVPASVVASRHHVGSGVEGKVKGRELRLGAADWLANWCAASPIDVPPGAPGEVRVHLASREQWLATFVLADSLRPDAAAAVAAMRALGCEVHLLSGDQVGSVESVAAVLEIKNRLARATPASKLDYVQQLQRNGRVVLMLGDGVNDAPVLAGADVSLAMAGASDVASASADGLLLGSQLGRLAETLQRARMTRRIIRQNLGWAMVYNAAAVPLAALGLVSPWLAGVGMAASSLVVVGNALRLGR